LAPGDAEVLHRHAGVERADGSPWHIYVARDATVRVVSLPVGILRLGHVDIIVGERGSHSPQCEELKALHTHAAARAALAPK
jgi:hypothetical protein